MEVVVTGGCGYIGSHVARAFKQNGDKVFIVDRVQRNHTLKDMDGWLIDDFASDAALSAIYYFDPDIIVHCAGTSLVGPSITNPAEYYDNNITKTLELLDFVKGFKKTPKLMFSSSASVYGEPDSVPIPESAKKNPISPYGNTKYVSELMFRDYSRAYGLDIMCFRYFNAAGACPITHDLGQEPGATHIVARALEASISQQPFIINGRTYVTADGTCVRDYVHVWDIALAHVRGAGHFDYFDDDRNSIFQVYNLGTNAGVSNLEIATYVQDKYGLEILFGEPRSGDPAILIADATLARQELGWEPVNSGIKQIIDDAYAWYTRS